jgi:hypothetical protein
MFLSHLFNRAIGVSMVLLFFHSYAGAQEAPERMYQAVLQQAELMPQQHLNRRNQSELVVVDNGVLPSTQFRDWRWFDRPVKWMTNADLQRMGRTSYLQLTQFELVNERLVRLAFVVHCAEGCANYQHRYEFAFDVASNEWQVVKNESFYTTID